VQYHAAQRRRCVKTERTMVGRLLLLLLLLVVVVVVVQGCKQSR